MTIGREEAVTIQEGAVTKSEETVSRHLRTPSTQRSQGGTPWPQSPSPVQQRGGKRSVVSSSGEGSSPSDARKRLKFLNVLRLNILLPNSTAVDVVCDLADDTTINALIRKIREANANKSKAGASDSKKPTRQVQWDGGNLTVQTLEGEVVDISLLVNLAKTRSTSHTFLLSDGVEKDSSYVDDNLWNVTPRPEMLGQLPQGYTLETALADQVDNALQAVWPNKERRLVSIELGNDKICIFDTGQGMDNSPENCIANWGTVGGSTHRSVHHKGIGGEPPYLKPYLGKYGAGGVAAALHLGGCVTVSSKTKQSKKVVTLRLEHTDLVQKHKLNPEQGIWRTRGEFREMTPLEKEKAPHGSFTRVVISKLKSQYCIRGSQQYWKVEKVKQLLKDIYFPYIQSESASRTITPVEFEVNGTNLLEVTDCEMAIANQATCIGAPFVFSLHMTRSSEDGHPNSTDEANARITCQYFPIQRGKEALETVLEEVSKLRPGNPVTFETMHRVVVRWLGRLLPEAKWSILPFMEVTAKKEQRLHVKRQWAKRVRAYVETDAGFQPNQSKLELDRDHPFTLALKQLGNSDDLSETLEPGVHLDVKIAGQSKQVNSTQLIEAYMAWLEDMHSRYDEEVTFLDDPAWLFSHPNADKELGVYKQVIVFHKRLKDTTGEWNIDAENPLRVRFLRGSGGLKADLYATVEFFFKEGDDEHGEVKILCRAIDVDESDGCNLFEKNGRLCFELRKSQWLPGSALNGGKCQRVDSAAWKRKAEELSNKAPGYIEILDEEDLKKLELSGAFPRSSSKFEAGFTLPAEIVVVVRPKKGSGPSFKQGMIVGEAMFMHLTITHCKCTGPACRMNGRNSLPGEASSSNEEHTKLICKLMPKNFVSKTGIKGLYSFSVGSSDGSRLTRQGTYTFHFSLENSKCSSIKTATSTIRIIPSRSTAKWKLSAESRADNGISPDISIRLNEQLSDDLILRKYDKYDNQQSFEKPIPVEVKIVTPRGESLEMTLKATGHIMPSGEKQQGGLQIKFVQGLFFSSGLLELVEPSYDALLRVYVTEEQYGEIRCKVLPGALASIKVKVSKPPISMGAAWLQEPLRAGEKFDKPLNAKDSMWVDNHLRPGEIIKRLTLQGLDASGNKIDKHQKMRVRLKGLEFQDNFTEEREVDDNGCLHLGGLLQVTAQHNSRGYVEIFSDSGRPVCNIGFKTVTRKLIATQVPSKCFVGKNMKGIILKIVDEFGTIDTGVDGYGHSVVVDWQKGVTFPFEKGECALSPVLMPENPGWWTGKVRYSANQNLLVELKVELELSAGCVLMNPPRQEPNLVLTARCGTPFEVPFWVADEQGLPALLPDSVKDTIVVKGELNGGDETTRPCRAMQSNIVKSGKDGGAYKADVVITGDVGPYSITMMDASLKFRGEVRYTCNLSPGKVSQLVVEFHHADVCEQHGQKEVHIPVFEEFPRMTVTLLDLEGNLNTYCEGKDVSMSADNCQQFKEVQEKVRKGTASFKSFPLKVPVGTYSICVALNTPEALEYRYRLVVEHGTYPSALRLTENDDFDVALGGAEMQVRLPLMRVEVESANGARVQWRKLSVGLRIRSMNPAPLNMQSCDAPEFLGIAIDPARAGFSTQNSGSSSSGGSLVVDPVKFEFRDVNAPTTAGDYELEYFIRDFDVEPKHRRLKVTHGPPCKLDIVRGPCGEALEVLEVNLLDGHQNRCDSVSGVEIGFHFCLNPTFSKKLTVTDHNLEPCSVQSNQFSTIMNGTADFGPFILTDGLPALYDLEVGAKDTNLTPAKVQIFVTRGKPDDSIRQQVIDANNANAELMEYCKMLQEATEHIGHRQREKLFLNKMMHSLQDEKLRLLQEQREVRELQEVHGDDSLLDVELQQPVRGVNDVMQELHRLSRSGTTAPLLICEAQQGTNFLNPRTDAGRDIVGLVVMLAQVENNALNRMLVEFLGTSALLMIVCRTQRGVSALEEYDRNDEIDESKGLHGFAKNRGKTLTKRFECLALTDLVRPYRRNDGQPSVIIEHPQKLLNIDPPVLPSGRCPEGFLGYAVNFLYLKDQHLGGTEENTVGQATPQGLRETLFYSLLQNLQVYDTRDNMIRAKSEIRFTSGAISLDGGFIRKNQRQQLGRRSEHFPVSFANVEPERRLSTSLHPPACHAFRRRYVYLQINRDIARRDEELAVKKREFDKCEHIFQGVTTSATELQKKCNILDRNASIKIRLHELGKAQDLLVRSEVGRKAKNLPLSVRAEAACLGDPSLNMEENENSRMRAFIM